MGGQPGKPKPPGDPPGPREPQRPPPVEEPPRPIPVPPVDRPPPPMQVYPERCLTTAPGRMPSEPARRAVDAGLGGLFHQLSLEPARRHTPTPSVDRVLMLEPAVELAQHRRAVFQATPTGYRRRAGWPEGRRLPPANFARFSAGLLCFPEIAPRLSVRNLFHLAASLQLA